MGVGVFFFDATGGGTNSDHSLFDACAGAKTDSTKKKEKLAPLNALAFIIFAPRSETKIAHYETTRD
jgi:hypothetical protein